MTRGVLAWANRRTKLELGILGFLSATVPYHLLNQLGLFSPKPLPMSPVDSAVPFVPVTIWIYLSDYFFIIGAYLLAKRREPSVRFILALVSVEVVSLVIFILFPTIIDRAAFPLPVGEMGPTLKFAWDTLRTADKPTNCFPSLHIGTVGVSLLLLIRVRRGLERAGWILWAGLIAVSTLTTKQHYFIDILGGALVAGLSDWFWRTREPN